MLNETFCTPILRYSKWYIHSKFYKKLLMNIKLNKKLILMIVITVSLMNIISKGLIGRHVSKTKDIKMYYFSLIFKIIARYEYIFNAINMKLFA